MQRESLNTRQGSKAGKIRVRTGREKMRPPPLRAKEKEYATGSLTVKNIRPEHTGCYEANLIQSKSSGTSQSLNRNNKCDSRKIIKNNFNIGDTIKTFSVSVSDKSLADERCEVFNYFQGNSQLK